VSDTYWTAVGHQGGQSVHTSPYCYHIRKSGGKVRPMSDDEVEWKGLNVCDECPRPVVIR